MDNDDMENDGMDDDGMDDEPVVEVEEVMIEAIPAPSANAQGNATAANTPSSKGPVAKNPAKKTNTNASEKPIEKLPTVTDQSSITPLNNSYSGLRSARPIQAIGSDASKSVDNAVEELPEDGAPKAVENTNQMNQTNQTIQNDSDNQTRNMSEDNTLKTDQTPVPATH